MLHNEREVVLGATCPPHHPSNADEVAEGKGTNETHCTESKGKSERGMEEEKEGRREGGREGGGREGGKEGGREGKGEGGRRGEGERERGEREKGGKERMLMHVCCV